MLALFASLRPAFVYVVLGNGLVFSGVSDWADGKIARLQSSRLGAGDAHALIVFGGASCRGGLSLTLLTRCAAGWDAALWSRGGLTGELRRAFVFFPTILCDPLWSHVLLAWAFRVCMPAWSRAITQMTFGRC